MITVWNCKKGDVYAFKDIEAYKAFARETEGNKRTCWEDEVHDVGGGGVANDTNYVDMDEFNSSIT